MRNAISFFLSFSVFFLSLQSIVKGIGRGKMKILSSSTPPHVVLTWDFSFPLNTKELFSRMSKLMCFFVQQWKMNSNRLWKGQSSTIKVSHKNHKLCSRSSKAIWQLCLRNSHRTTALSLHFCRCGTGSYFPRSFLKNHRFQTTWWWGCFRWTI